MLILRDTIATVRELAWHVRAIHGVAHWARVARYGQALTEQLALTLPLQECVQIFAWTHDLARTDDGGGNAHARDGGKYFDSYAAKIFPQLSPMQHELIRTALHHHSDGITAEEGWHQGWFTHLDGSRDDIINTMGCWDADRLDLLRLGIEPDPNRMSTPFWDEILQLSRRLNRM